MGKAYTYSAHKKKTKLANKHLKVGLISLIISKQQCNTMFPNSISTRLKNFATRVIDLLKTVSTKLTIQF